MQQLPLLLAFCALLFIGCSSSETSNRSTVTNFPEGLALLDRPAAIHNGEEWDQVRNRYVAAREKLKVDPQDVASMLDISRLFVYEARVSGEHGHYYPAVLALSSSALEVPSITADQRYQALTIKASAELSQHDFEQALETAKAALALNPRSAVVYGALTDAYVELGMYPEAIQAADQMVQIKPDLRSYARVSYLREIHGNVDGSFEAMRLALDAGAPGTEDVAWTRTTLADLLKEYGRVEEAQDQYELTLDDRPNYVFAKAGLAQLHIDNKEYDKAEALLTSSIEAVPEVGLFEQMYDVYKATGRSEEADKTKDEVLAMFKDDVDHGHNMNLEYADFYLNRLNDPASAMKFTSKEYALRPNNIDVNRRMAEISLQLGYAEKAREHLLAAQKTKSASPKILKIEKQLDSIQQLSFHSFLQPNNLVASTY